jgi:hypothetical protein
MLHVLLLTDDASFHSVYRKLMPFGELKFDYLILNGNELADHETAENDFNQILKACNGKNIVIIQVSGNKAIYLLDVLLHNPGFVCKQVILVQSPLIDFYYRPVEDFYVDQAIRRKLDLHHFKISVIRPMTAYFMPFTAARLKENQVTQMPLLSLTNVYRQILSDIEEDAGWGKTRYFLPEVFAKRINMVKVLKMGKKKLFHLLLPFERLQHSLFYRKLLEEEALCQLMNKLNELPDVLFLQPTMRSLPEQS